MARRIFAVLVIAMAVGQLSDVAGFVDILGDYDVGGTAVAALLAFVLIGGELAAGAGLLSGRGAARQRGAAAGLGVALLWSGLAVQAFARGLAIDNCGCFGAHLAQELRWWVLVEDLEFVALALWVRHRVQTPAPADRLTEAVHR